MTNAAPPVAVLRMTLTKIAVSTVSITSDFHSPPGADGLGNFMAGMHLVSELLLRELHEATGGPPEATLQRLAILAEHRRGTPSAG